MNSILPSSRSRTGCRLAGRATAIVCAAALLLPATAPAQPRTADPAVRGVPLAAFPRFVVLADGVYAYEEIRSPGFTTVSLVVVGDSGVLVADGQGSRAATRRLLDELRTVTSRPVRWYIVGSDHGDHTAGNAELPAGVTWVVHRTSRRQLQADSASAAAAYRRAVADSTATGGVPPVARTVIVPPRAMSGDRERIDVGGRVVDVLFLGRAHTGGDLMVHLPREKILFMSEAYLNRVFPAMRSAYPAEWIRTIERALAMDVVHFIPGHGFVETPAVSREELVAFRDALVAVVAEVTRLQRRGLAVESAIAEARWGAYGDWFLAGQQAPVAVRRVYAALAGELP